MNVAAWSDIVEIPSLSFSVSHRPVDVAIDTLRDLVYTTGGWHGSNLLTKFDLASRVETVHDLRAHGIGVAVDEVHGYAYVTLRRSSIHHHCH